MSDYVKILVAIDLSDDSNRLLQRARAVAASPAAELHTIHRTPELCLRRRYPHGFFRHPG
jgi:nucleotide-binding universal stress UspA family protein